MSPRYHPRCAPPRLIEVTTPLSAPRGPRDVPRLRDGAAPGNGGRSGRVYRPREGRSGGCSGVIFASRGTYPACTAPGSLSGPQTSMCAIEITAAWLLVSFVACVYEPTEMKFRS